MCKKALCLIFAFLLSIESFAAVVSDNDGAAFITKAEFDSLKNNFQAQLDSYNTNIDNKIDNAIAGYLAGIKASAEREIDSTLNLLNEARRTFVGNITNPTTSTQANLFIETCSFWAYFRTAEQSWANSDAGPWLGFEISGINNYGPDIRAGGYVHHVRYPLALDNLNYGSRTGNGRYVFIEPASSATSESEMYITDEYLKNLKLKIWSVGGATSYQTPELLHSPKPYDTTSITWNNRYNWAGTNYRTVATYEGAAWNWNDKSQVVYLIGSDRVLAAESIYLDVSNEQLIPWVNNVSGGTIFSNTTGCLKTEDQYYWTYRYTNFHNGTVGSQCYGACYKIDNTYYNGTNDNTTTNQCGLNFYAPKISNIYGNKLLIKDVGELVGVRTHYFNGLPVCVIDKEGELELEMKITLNGVGTTSFNLAVGKNQFSNASIMSEPASNILYRESKNINDSDIKNGVLKIKIGKDKLSGIKNGTLWVKAMATNGTNSSITLETNSIKIKYDS